MAVEAGTGVGKSFAYLIPAVLRCILHGEKVVIATATISLQEQLITKDIPLIQETLASWNYGGHLRADLVPVLAKGAERVSIRRLQMASSRQEVAVARRRARRVCVIEDWAYGRRTVAIDAARVGRPEVWTMSVDTDNCMGRKCRTTGLFLGARRRMEQARLIVQSRAVLRGSGAADAIGDAV